MRAQLTLSTRPAAPAANLSRRGPRRWPMRWRGETGQPATEIDCRSSARRSRDAQLLQQRLPSVLFYGLLLVKNASTAGELAEWAKKVQQEK